MRRWPYPGISARIIGPFLLVVILIAGIGVFTVTRLVAGSVQERFSNQLADSASAASNSIADIERQQLGTLRLMAFTKDVPDAILAGDIASLDLWLRPIAANATLDDVIVFNREGKCLLRLRRIDTDLGIQYDTAPLDSLKEWGGIQRVLSTNVDPLGDKFVDIIGQAANKMMYISAPVQFSDGMVAGGISVGLATTRVARRVSAQSLSAVTLYASNGEVLGSTFQAELALLALAPAHAAKLMDSMDGVSPIEPRTVDGTPYQILYAPLQVRSQRIGLLAVGLPSNFIVERSGTSRDVFGAMFSVLFVSVGILGITMARSITRPIAQLVQTTRAIRDGDLSKRVELSTPDELGELGTSFDHMTDQLVQRNIEINQLYQEQLQETARRHAMLSSIGDAVIVQDLGGRVILRNPTADSLVRIIAGNSASRREFVNLCRHPTSLAEPKTVSFADQVFSVLATPVCLESGDLLGHVIVFRDITALAEAERLKDELIQQMSHELRTPLTAARGYIDLVKMLEQTNLTDQGSIFLGSATDSLSTLERMVDQVIDVSTLISNEFTPHFAPFNLAKLLSDQVDEWTPAARERDLTISLYLSASTINVEGDEKWLRQVVDHILRNAVSFTLPGGSIQVHGTLTKSRAIIWVVDNGVGIGPQEIDRVFDRMYRGQSADAGPTDTRGLGLGLYSSRRIVEAHYGTISLQSQLERGTTVTIELPLRQRSR